MKIKSKIFIISLIIVSIFLFVGCGSKLSINNVKSIEIISNNYINQNQLSTIHDATLISEIGELINAGLQSSKITDHIISNDFVFNLTYNNETTRSFIIDFDLMTSEAYLTEGEHTYWIDSEDASKFINSVNFSTYFDLQFIEPTMTLQVNDKSSTFYQNSTFTYKTFNNSEISNSYNSEDDLINNPEILPITSLDSILEYTFDIQPNHIVEHIYQDNELIESLSLTNSNIHYPNVEGIYSIELECSWDQTEDRQYYGTSIYTFFIEIDFPVVFEITESIVSPGDAYVITAKNVNENQELHLKTSLYDIINLYPYKDYYVAVIPVNSWVEAGHYEITASTTETNAKENSIDFDVEVLHKEFDTQYLHVSESTSALRNDDNSAHDQKYFDASRANPIQKKLWEGPFLQPVDGIITTEYSALRYTNDNPVPSRHLALDIANSTGTDIMASNTGVVTLAMELIITGNTVVIDHGMGIFSSYVHMNEISVNEGDSVSKGDIIGTVGSTGYSTGPHLHFAFWKDGAFLNPWTLFEKDPLDF